MAGKVTRPILITAGKTSSPKKNKLIKYIAGKTALLAKLFLYFPKEKEKPLSF